MSYINMFLSTEPVGGFMGFMTKYGGTIILVVAMVLIFYFFRSKPFSFSVCSSLCKFFSFVKQISAGSTC